MEVSSVFLGPLGAIFFIGITILLLLIWHSIRKQRYWKEKGVPFAKPYPLVGCVLEDLMTPQHDNDIRRNKELGLVFGHYEGNSAALSIADPALLRLITVKDFAFFANRRSFNFLDDIMNNMVANLEGEDWKRVRTIITPTFTTGKLKRMIGIFKECCGTLIQNYRHAGANGKPINIKKLYGAMTMDVIASAAFSTRIDSHNDPENKFVRMTTKLFQSAYSWRIVIFILAPSLMRFLGISVFHPECMDFFKKATLHIIEERKKTKQVRNDFLQLLMDTAEEVVKEEKSEENDDLINNYGEVASNKTFNSSVTKSLSMDELVAQCILFFIAGYESTATTLTFATYCLAVNTDVQEKAREEIKKCLQQTQGEITYECLQNMKYLDNVISETLRVYPPATRLERKTVADYKLDDTGITIEKGTMVTIPVYSLHMDEKYYPQPHKFDPDRFTIEERSKRDPYVYMPFGAGPRNCIGMRFALLEAKICLVHVLSHFNIQVCSKTEIPLKFKPALGILRTKEIYIKIEPREDCLIK